MMSPIASKMTSCKTELLTPDVITSTIAPLQTAIVMQDATTLQQPYPESCNSPSDDSAMGSGGESDCDSPLPSANSAHHARFNGEQQNAGYGASPHAQSSSPRDVKSTRKPPTTATLLPLRQRAQRSSTNKRFKSPSFLKDEYANQNNNNNYFSSDAAYPSVNGETCETNSYDDAAATNCRVKVKRERLNSTGDVTTPRLTSRRFSTASSGKDRVLMRQWLTNKVESGAFAGMQWFNKEKTQIRIPWKHGSKTGWSAEEDCQVFKAWAEHTGKHHSEPKRWKANFRCAMRSLGDVVVVETLSEKRGSDPFIVYELKPERARKSLRKKTQTVDGITEDVSNPGYNTADSRLSNQSHLELQLPYAASKSLPYRSTPEYHTPAHRRSAVLPTRLADTRGGGVPGVAQGATRSGVRRLTPAAATRSEQRVLPEVTLQSQNRVIPTMVMEMESDSESPNEQEEEGSMTSSLFDYCDSPTSSTSGSSLLESQSSGYNTNDDDKIQPYDDVFGEISTDCSEDFSELLVNPNLMWIGDLSGDLLSGELFREDFIVPVEYTEAFVDDDMNACYATL